MIRWKASSSFHKRGSEGESMDESVVGSWWKGRFNWAQRVMRREEEDGDGVDERWRVRVRLALVVGQMLSSPAWPQPAEFILAVMIKRSGAQVPITITIMYNPSRNVD
ncbi:hypothetical protein ACE6H2_021164 [Prunus campanulata]